MKNKVKEEKKKKIKEEKRKKKVFMRNEYLIAEIEFITSSIIIILKK